MLITHRSTKELSILLVPLLYKLHLDLITSRFASFMTNLAARIYSFTDQAQLDHVFYELLPRLLPSWDDHLLFHLPAHKLFFDFKDQSIAKTGRRSSCWSTTSFHSSHRSFLRVCQPFTSSNLTALAALFSDLQVLNSTHPPCAVS